MKNIHFFNIIIVVAIVFVSVNCTKEAPATGTVSINTPPPPVNTAPIVNAGKDIELVVPVNFCDLIGSAFDREDNIQTFLWKRISGPALFLIHNPNSLSAKLSRLEIGGYQFELTVTDKMGLIGKDTINITVNRLPSDTHEIILDNQTWIFPWYNAIEIDNIYNYLPAGGSPFRIFIRRDTNPGWIEVEPISYSVTSGPYEYFIETRPHGAGIYNYRSLYIFYYGTDVSDTPSVKIVY